MDLEEHFEAARQRVVKQPDDIEARGALWQIFAARGEFDRARVQLDTIARLDPTWVAEVSSCKSLLIGEEARQRVFEGKATPECPGTPPAWFSEFRDASIALMACMMEAGTGKAEVENLARSLGDRAGAPANSSGSLNGKSFSRWADGDARLGPVFEMIVGTHYCWIPWVWVASVRARAPGEIRDLLWVHAHVELKDQDSVTAFLPARYPRPRNDAEKMARSTHWEPLSGDQFIGFGQKCYLTDTEELGILDIRELTFNIEA